MTELRLALRNLTRHRRRSAATCAAVALSAAGLMLFGGYVVWAHRGSETHGSVLFGSFQIFREGFNELGAGNPAAYALTDYEEMRRVLLADPELAPRLAVVTGRLVFSGLVTSADQGTSAGFIGTGTVPEDLERLGKWNPYHLSDVWSLEVNKRLMGDGPQLDPADPEGGTLGSGLARILQIPPPVRGSDPASRPSVELLSMPPGGSLPNIVTLAVRHALPRGLEMLDNSQIVLPLAQASSLLFPGEPTRATSILVLVRHPRDAAAVRAAVHALARKHGWAIETRSPEELYPIYRTSLAMMDLFFSFAFAIVAVVLVFTIYNTVMMGIVERTQEIGTLRAMGATRPAILRLFLWEGTLIGAIGGLGGLALGALAAALVNASTITYQPPTVPFHTKLEVRVLEEPALIAAALGSCLVVALVASFFPARRASRLAIVDALRST